MNICKLHHDLLRYSFFCGADSWPQRCLEWTVRWAVIIQIKYGSQVDWCLRTGSYVCAQSEAYLSCDWISWLWTMNKHRLNAAHLQHSCCCFITGLPTHSVGGRLVTVTGVCRRRMSSVGVCNAAGGQAGRPLGALVGAPTARHSGGRHSTVGQYSYVPLGRHLVAFNVTVNNHISLHMSCLISTIL